jgi:DNA topoisomerase-2
MKGKILNVRGEQTKKIAENKEIADIKKILGLETGRSYGEEDVKKVLRYGKIIFMTDQDLDGSHIKGLGINLFQSEWASLANIPNFIGFMNTPILKARKGNQELVFYNEGEYQTWKTEQLGLTSDVVDISEPVKGWKIKYYKGLGTSTGKEFREYFEKKKFVGFKHLGKSSDDAIDMVFNKKRADDRKIWLGKYNREDYLDTNKSDISYEEFINRELIHFSKYDCDRSIPNLMDGLKISLRKILYSAFKKGLTHEIKVAQFTGYVSEHSGYHHGEASLNAAIVGLAQNFVGSNNINLFAPNGQFGTRLKGGQDSASERYIFTHLNRITRHIFNEQDDKILKYLNDDGLLVEPLYYAPILPMILVNGAKGIGTGFSTDIMSYNPTTIIQYLKSKLMLEDTSNIHFIPYYEGFTGTITPVTQSQHDGKFLIRGKYEKVGPDKIRVTELPVGTWTDDFKEYLETLADASAVDKAGKKIPAIVKDYDDMSKDTTIDFTITLAKGKVAELEAVALENGCNGLEKQFKLFTTGSTSNMHLFDASDKLKKYGSVNEIIDDYFETRLDMYKVRKEYMIEALTKELVLLTNKMRYIRENLDGTIDLRRKKKDEVVAMLKNKGFDVIGDDEDYKYLTKMAMDSVTEENVAKLEKEHGDKETELNRVKETTIQQMWFGELEKLEEEYVRFREERERSMSGDAKKKSGGGANIVKKKSAPKKQLTLVE